MTLDVTLVETFLTSHYGDGLGAVAPIGKG